MKHLFDALDLVDNERETRNFLALNRVLPGFSAGSRLFLTSALAAIVVLLVVFEDVRFGGAAWWLSLLRSPALP